MGKMIFSITEENENILRSLNRKKGDMSNIVNNALHEYFLMCDLAHKAAEK